MKSDWPIVKLADYCDKIGSGATPRGGSKVYLDSGEISLVRSQNVYNHGFDYDGLVYIDEEAAEKLSNVELEENDVLINITGDSVARVCMVPHDVLPARVNQHVSILRPKNDSLDPQFLRYSLVNYENQYKLLAIASAGGTRKAITKGHLEDFEISLPDLNYQKKVSEILSTFDQKIHLNQQTNETLEAMAQAIFKSWFVDFDPVRAKIEAKSAGRDHNRAATAVITGISLDQDWDEVESALDQKLSSMTEEQRQQLTRTTQLFPDELVESEIGVVPKGWEVRTAEEILKRFRAPKRVKKDDVEETGEVVVLEQGEGIIMGYHNQKAGFNASPDNPHFIFGDHTCITHLVIEPFDIAPNVIPLQGEEFDSYWTYYAIRDLQQFQEYRRHWRELKVKEVVTPNYELDELFAEFIKPLIIKINKNRNENLTLSQLRDTLLPKLISGEIQI